MKFLVDAQLPKSLSDLITSLGYDSIHTLDLPDKNRSGDAFIMEFSVRENMVVITKDGDFLESFLLKNQPQKLVIVRTGNIKNQELLLIFNNHLLKVVELLTQGNLVEITREEIILHK